MGSQRNAIYWFWFINYNIYNPQHGWYSSTLSLTKQQRSFQKQEPVFLNSKKLLAKKTTSGVRYYKNVGLNFRTPKEAIEGSYIDKKCPFTSNVSIRGKILKGVVISTKMQRTIIVRRDYLHYVPKYNRYEKRHRNLPAHISPALNVKIGDIVLIGECRPLSKTVHFNVLKVTPQEIVGNVRKQFMLFWSYVQYMTHITLKSNSF